MQPIMKKLLRGVLGLAGAALGLTVAADEASVAVAANFTDAAQEIAERFTEETGHKAILSFGSTGQLYAQITQGAPFAVFLAADQARPLRAEAEGHAVAGSRFTYATGRLVLWSADPALIRDERVLSTAAFDKIAIANPVTAPYGKAAVQAMQNLGVHADLEPKLVRGNNIVQTYQFVATANAELGFVALSQVIHHNDGSRWLVPAELYEPIRQDAVLLKQGAGNEAAKAFVEFLKSPAALAVIETYGYGVTE